MQDNESVLLTAEGNNGNIELTETSLKINKYKKGLMGYDKSKISKVHEIPRDAITEARVSQNEFYVFVPDGFLDVDPCGYFAISIDVDGGYWQGFKNIAEEIGLQGYWYEDNSKLSHIESYDSEEQASIDVDSAAKSGWKALGSSATDGHINIGRTVAKTILTGGIGLAVLGGSRTKGKVTVTYERTPEWLASNNKAAYLPSVPTHAVDPQTVEDPLQKMKQLKDILDAGLISQEEYDKTKAAILARM